LLNYSGSGGLSHDPVTIVWLNDSITMTPNDLNYHAYLLRLRRVENAGQPVWRFSLERPGRVERHHFDQLIEVVAYLQQQMRRDELAADEAANDKSLDR
jgi:hypothetical protein